MNILGISAFYHDSAACLVKNGEIVAAAQEERFTRKKHDQDFPKKAVDYCLEEGGIKVEDLDHVAFYDKPLLKFERLLETWIGYAPVGFRQFAKGLPTWIKQKLHTPRALDRGLDGRYKGRYIFLEHHESHAASAFFPSPYEEAAILTMDGVGEWTTGSVGLGRGNKMELLQEMRFPHSLGLLYSAFTYYCGFKVNSGEYKLMGLAPYGQPKYKDLILEKLLDLKADGSFRMDMSYFEYCQGLVMTSPKFDRLFGGKARSRESQLTEREMDLAASIQVVTEEIMLRVARHAHSITKAKNLVLAGGVALNCVANGRILRDGPFEELWIQPAAGDAGGALGAALFVWHQLLGRPRTAARPDLQKGSLLGPEVRDDEVATFLASVSAKATRFPTDAALNDAVAELLATENVVGRVSGRMEFGPRALGNRSIIGDARSPKMQTVMNVKIKFRESFRPFAPSVLREEVDEWFETRPDEDSPYMLIVAPVKPEKLLPQQNGHATGLDKLKQLRSLVPAITHVDNSARLQTVDATRHGEYYRLIKRFHEKTGCPIIINTSFNVRGEPIVCTPADAWRCFMATNMDALVLGRHLLLKKDQPEAKDIVVDDYLKKFELD